MDHSVDYCIAVYPSFVLHCSLYSSLLRLAWVVPVPRSCLYKRKQKVLNPLINYCAQRMENLVDIISCALTRWVGDPRKIIFHGWLGTDIKEE